MKLPPPQLEKSWQDILEKEWKKSYLPELATFIARERAEEMVYPPKEEVFAAFNATPFAAVQVVVIGQDPYHGRGQAHGLSFSVRHGVAFPPSLQNIFKELEDDLKIPKPLHGSLLPWARQGVLMLNAVLTVREHTPNSHAGKGWEIFTDAVVSALVAREDPVIFLLWGKLAQNKCRHILSASMNRHFVLSAPHPSPFSAHAGFFGCRHFSRCNELLIKQGKKEIDWRNNSG